MRMRMRMRMRMIRRMVTLGLCLQPPDTLYISGIGGRIVGRSDEAGIPDLTVKSQITDHRSQITDQNHHRSQ